MARIATLALDALGRTHRAVAASLAAAGFTGRTESACDCPIARYLCASDPRLSTVTVDCDTAHLDLPGESALVSLPDPVLAFVARFDLCHYPQLIASALPSYPAAPGTTARQEDRS